nr:VID27-like protein [Coffea arabica]
MVRIRGGSTSAGRSFRLRDEDIEIMEPPPVAPKKKSVTRGGKVKQTAQRKLDIPTAESYDEQLEEQSSEENIAGGNEEPEQAVRGDKAVTRSSAKRKRKSPRTRTEAQNVEASATQTSNRKRSGKNPVSQLVEEPTPLPKFIDDEARDRFENLLVPPIPESNVNEPRTEPTGPTTGAETTLASSSQSKDKGKAPATEESDEDSDEETEEEEDPAQYRLARRRLGSSKITI